MTYTIGLTGGIGSGKTVASDHFAELGVPVIDTDIIARRIVEPGQSALQQLTDEFGTQILDQNGNLDRSALRALAFANADNKATLDSITHPAIRAQAQTQIDAVVDSYCIVVIPLLTADSEFFQIIMRTLVVVAEHETKIKRVKTRSALSRNQIEQIMKTQLTDRERLVFADDVINNDSSINYVHLEVNKLHQKYQQLAQLN